MADIRNEQSNTLVSGTDLSDKVTNRSSGTNVTIVANGGDGNDYIENSGKESFVTGGAGDDTIDLGGHSIVNVISAYDGGYACSVDGGDGNDSISGSGGKASIRGGKGDDTIKLYNTDALIEYALGDGNDFIEGFGRNSTLSIGDGLGTYHAERIIDDYVLTIGDGSVTMKDAALISLDDLNILGNADASTDLKIIHGTATNDSIANNIADAKILALDGDDTIKNTYASVSIDGGTGNDDIYNDGGYYATIDGGDGNDSITNSGSDASINGGDGNDSITNSGNDASIDGGTGNDDIYNTADVDVTITTGEGDDTIKVGNASVKDFAVRDFDANDCIELYDTVTSISIDGSVLVAGDLKIYGVVSDTDEEYFWMVKDGKATYTKKALNNFKLLEDHQTIVFDEDSIQNLFTIEGLSESATADDLSFDDYSKVVTVSLNALSNTDDVTLSDLDGSSYRLALGEDVTTSQTTGGSWKLSGTTATYETGGTTEGYELATDSKTINHVEASAGGTLVTVDGVKSVSGLSLDGKVVTVSKTSLGTGSVSISGEGYKLALGEDVTTSQTTGGSWKLSGTKATYETGTTTEGYELATDSKTINHVAGNEGDTLVTVDGVKSVSGLSLDTENKTITIDPKSIDSKAKCASVSGSDYTFELKGSGKLFAGENTILKGSTKNDTFIANVAATLDGGKGNDIYVYDGGNVTVEYSASGANGTDKVSLGEGFEIVGVTEDDDGITLALSKKDSLGEEDYGEYSLTLNGANSDTKVNLVTTEYVYKNGAAKTKATSSTIYFADSLIRDNKDDKKVKKVTALAGGNTDFGNTTGDGKNRASVYKKSHDH